MLVKMRGVTIKTGMSIIEDIRGSMINIHRHQGGCSLIEYILHRGVVSMNLIEATTSSLKEIMIIQEGMRDRIEDRNIEEMREVDMIIDTKQEMEEVIAGSSRKETIPEIVLEAVEIETLIKDTVHDSMIEDIILRTSMRKIRLTGHQIVEIGKITINHRVDSSHTDRNLHTEVDLD